MGAYTKNLWADNDPTKPLSAARMSTMETGIFNAHTTNETSIPGSPYDGQEIFYAADATNGIYWHLRYRSAASGSFKWEFVGGSCLCADVETFESTTSATYTDLATAGPSVTVPRAGDYEVTWGAFLQISPSTGNRAGWATIKRGAAAAADTDGLRYDNGNNINGVPGARLKRFLGLAASDVLKMQYKISADTMNVRYRWLSVKPLRVI